MGLFEGVTGRLREMRERRAKQRARSLILETEKAEAELRSEAKRLGMELGSFAQRSHYATLGIAYTTDQKEIRSAYLKLVKRYHPDISSDSEATRKTEEINAAYAVLKDKRLKADYDAASLKGKATIGEDAARRIEERLVNEYMERRKRDFEEFNKRVAAPMTRDAANAAIEDVADWGRRFNSVSNSTFGKLWDSGRRIRHLDSVNRSLARAKDGRELAELQANGERLGVLVKAFGEMEKGIRMVIDNTRKRIGGEESRISEKLRGSVN